MGSVIQKLVKEGKASPPKFLPDNIHYEVMMGSVAYAVSGGGSDIDVYGWAIPPKEYVFPHLRGEIAGFGKTGPAFDQYQQHHLKGNNGKDYDLTCFSIVKYFQLVMQNNPNMIDSLFVPRNCVLHITQIGEMVRENRKLFLHKGAWHKFKGYAYSQLSKMKVLNRENEHRQASIDRHGYDVKFAYHVVRLINEVEQIMVEHDLDLTRNNEQLKAIRAGEWTKEQIENYFDSKERELESLYLSSTLPYSPDEAKIKQLLLNCLEQHYGSLDKAIVVPEAPIQALRDISQTMDKYRRLWE